MFVVLVLVRVFPGHVEDDTYLLSLMASEQSFSLPTSGQDQIHYRRDQPVFI